MKSINDKLIDVVRRQTREGDNTVDLLTDILPLSKEAAYRRLRGEISFTLNEAITICQKFNISIDNLIGVKSEDKMVFHVHPIFPDNYLEKYEKLLSETLYAFQALSVDPQFTVMHAYNSLSTFCFRYPTITKLRVYSGGHMNVKLPKFSEFEVPKKIEKMLSEYLDFYSKIKSYHVWDSSACVSLVRYAQYMKMLHLITDKEIADLKYELHLYFDEMERLVSTNKYPSENKTSIYISKLFFDASYTYLESSNYKACGVGVYGISYVSCEHPVICEANRNWIFSLIKSSTLISNSGEVERQAFFRQQHIYVDLLDGAPMSPYTTSNVAWS